MPPEKVYDIIGVGIGPFNLGLAALCHEIPELNCLFIDQNEFFNWHACMMIPGSRLQVPFYADLVTLADPCNKFNYLAFLKAKKRMFRFAIQENYFIKRTEYNEYCQWVAGQLSTLKFGITCEKIEKDSFFYRVSTAEGTYLAQKVILGTGTVPHVPDLGIKPSEKLFHSSDYLRHKETVLGEDSITIIGSGQSAAEIFYDLAQAFHGNLHWFTRASHLYPMDYSKLALELSTPDYIDHFYSIPDRIKPQVLKSQDCLYKGINHSLISDIYDLLVEKDSEKISIHTNCELNKISGSFDLSFTHRELQKTFTHQTGAVILATGYKTAMPECIKPLRPFIHLDNQGFYKANLNYSVDDHNSIFIQNAEQSTHGFNASDLSLGPYRNAVILNSILGREYYTLEKNMTFQTFGLP